MLDLELLFPCQRNNSPLRDELCSVALVDLTVGLQVEAVGGGSADCCCITFGFVLVPSGWGVAALSSLLRPGSMLSVGSRRCCVFVLNGASNEETKAYLRAASLVSSL